MSYNNPNHNEVFSTTKGVVSPCKSYLNLAKMKFMNIYHRKPTLDDAKVLRNLIEEQWERYWITIKLEACEHKLGSNVWRYGLSLKVDVAKALGLFVLTRGNDIKYPILYLYSFNLVDEFLEFMLNNRKELKHIYKRNDYIDFSSQAYNNSADDL